MKKNLLILVFSLALLSLTAIAQAATPSLTLNNSGNVGDVQVTATGDANANVLLLYQKSTGVSYIQYIGKTNTAGIFDLVINTSLYDIAPSSPVSVKINNLPSAQVAWPYTSTTASGGAITFDQSGVVTQIGQSVTLNVNNRGANTLYLLNNSNPQIANVNLTGGQATVTANAYGQTVITVCVLGATSNCASSYITVQNNGAKALTFSQSNLTIAYNQNSQINIINSVGTYTILNNSNPSIVSASINGAIITLTANNNSGSASLTICSSDMSACGIITVTAGSISSSGITFNQTAPTIIVGQTLSVAISGGTSYNISNNSDSSVVQASISNTNLVLSANKAGTSLITVCSTNGNCGTITVTVNYVATGGPITLSQSNLWLQVGQVSSVTISGGTFPYSLLNNTNTNFQASLNGNILSLTGLSAGSASVNVCSAGGACIPLSVLVNGVSNTTQLTFSNNNLTLLAGNNSTVNLFGAGGYYVSASNNQNVATVVVSGDKAIINALSAGSANATICQTGGQCSVLYIAVNSGNTVVATPLTFSIKEPKLSIGEATTVSLFGTVGANYIVSSNSNPTVVQTNTLNNKLILVGLTKGVSVLVLCASNIDCGSLLVRVDDTTTVDPILKTIKTPTPTVITSKPTTAKAPVVIVKKYKFNKDLNTKSTGAEVKELQKRLASEGIYKGAISGKYSVETVTAVRAYQKKKKLSPVGVVGPSTRVMLNK